MTMSKFKPALAIVLASLVVAACAPAPERQIQKTPDLVLNGVGMTLETGFPAPAWGNVLPAKTPDELADLSRIAKATAETAVTAAERGNADLAVASFYWYRAYAMQVATVADHSVQALKEMNGRTATLPVPGRALIILPAFDRYAQDEQEFMKGIVQPGSGKRIPELPLGRAVRLDNGLFVERRNGGLAVYNPDARTLVLPLRDLNYLPWLPVPSQQRQQATPYLANMRNSVYEAFLKSNAPGHITVAAPNVVLVDKRTAFQLDKDGRRAASTAAAEGGRQAYKTGTPYQLALDLLATVPTVAPVAAFNAACRKQHLGYTYDLFGVQRELLKTTCVAGRGVPMTSKDFYVAGDNTVQSYEALLAEPQNVTAMTKRLVTPALVLGVGAIAPAAGDAGMLPCTGFHDGRQQSMLASIADVPPTGQWEGGGPTAAVLAERCLAKMNPSIAGAMSSNRDRYTDLFEIYRTVSNAEEAAVRSSALFSGNPEFAAMNGTRYGLAVRGARSTREAAEGFEKVAADYRSR